jgi:hypothetical protein
MMLEILDPIDAFPDYSTEARTRMARNRKTLEEEGVSYGSQTCDLLMSEDDLLDVIVELRERLSVPTLILDITSLPKRYFALMVKRALLFEPYPNVVVTYTQAGRDGYPADHLAGDPMPCDHLPGFGAPLPPKVSTLVVAVGFEYLSIGSLLEVYRDKKRATKFIMSFPPDGNAIRRQWRTLMQVASGRAENIDKQSLEVVAAWDVEQVYSTLARWNEDAEGLTLAPFGPKPHSLGMALFAITHDCGLYYTQPRSYNPSYSRGSGESWAYVLKWDGVLCTDRRPTPI